MKRFNAGFIVGALIGGTYALLHAPKSGQATRQDLLNYGRNLQTDATMISQDTQHLLQAVKQLNHDAKFVTQRVMSDMRDLAERAQTETQPRLRRLTESIQQFQTNLEDFKK